MTRLVEASVPARPQRAGSREDEPATRQLRALVVDAYPLVRLAVRRELEDGGIGVCGEAGSTDEAVDAALKTRPDVCLIDVSLPGGGLAAAMRILEQFPGTPVVMLGALEDAEGVHAAIEAGAAAYVAKEAEPSRLPLVARAVAMPPAETAPVFVCAV